MAIIDWNSEIIADRAAVLYEMNPVLGLAQAGIEQDTALFKIGDGVKKWNDLAYATINGQQNVWIGLSVAANNLLSRSQQDGGFYIGPDKFAGVDTLIAAMLPSAQPGDLDSSDPVKAAYHRLAVMMRDTINALGGEYVDLKNGIQPSKTIQQRLDAIESAGIDIDAILKDTVTATTSTWSSTKIDQFVNLKVATAIAELVGDAPETLDTIYKLAAAFGENQNLVTTITADLANTVRFNIAQNLNETQKKQARTNIGAASLDWLGETTNLLDEDHFTDLIYEGIGESTAVSPVIFPALV